MKNQTIRPVLSLSLAFSIISLGSCHPTPGVFPAPQLRDTDRTIILLADSSPKGDVETVMKWLDKVRPGYGTFVSVVYDFVISPPLQSRTAKAFLERHLTVNSAFAQEHNGIRGKLIQCKSKALPKHVLSYSRQGFGSSLFRMPARPISPGGARRTRWTIV
jgi:hypothetical protein